MTSLIIFLSLPINDSFRFIGQNCLDVLIKCQESKIVRCGVWYLTGACGKARCLILASMLGIEIGCHPGDDISFLGFLYSMK